LQLSAADENIAVLLHRLKNPTFFTRDEDFFQRELCHAGYCLVFLDLRPAESAQFIRRFLRHSRFRTNAERLGVVARVHHDGISFWKKHAPIQRIGWM